MPPRRIIIMRHAEKPDSVHLGVTADGREDPRSLSPVGWQRAGALCRFFCPLHPPPYSNMIPSAIFAAGFGGKDDSKRPMQTVTPLAELMATTGVPFVTKYLRDDIGEVMADVATRDGVVLVSWEHKRIPDLARRLVAKPEVPGHWPDERFDVLWLFDMTSSGWAFSQAPQLLLAGDSPSPIV